MGNGCIFDGDGVIMNYSGDHRKCDCENAKLFDTSQDISWSPNCVHCGKDLR